MAFDLDALGYSHPYNVGLSFDGQKLAFSTSADGDYFDRQLTILDITENKLARLCDDEYSSAWDGPIWSPDGRFVLQKVHNSRYRAFDVLVDTQTLHAYFSKSGYYEGPIAWLAKP